MIIRWPTREPLQWASSLFLSRLMLVSIINSGHRAIALAKSPFKPFWKLALDNSARDPCLETDTLKTALAAQFRMCMRSRPPLLWFMLCGFWFGFGCPPISDKFEMNNIDFVRMESADSFQLSFEIDWNCGLARISLWTFCIIVLQKYEET